MKNPLQLVINWFRLETQLAKVGRMLAYLRRGEPMFGRVNGQNRLSYQRVMNIYFYSILGKGLLASNLHGGQE